MTHHLKVAASHVESLSVRAPSNKTTLPAQIGSTQFNKKFNHHIGAPAQEPKPHPRGLEGAQKAPRPAFAGLGSGFDPRSEAADASATPIGSIILGGAFYHLTASRPAAKARVVLEVISVVVKTIEQDANNQRHPACLVHGRFVKLTPG